ncbi:MAG: RNA methyltransferase [Lachnospiraceae bacterium]|nr:RNA methyltransferase [Lachnospiraceae bacterium]
MITSADNKKIKNVVQLITKAKARREQDAFVIEGIKLFEEAPEDLIKEVYVSESCDYKSIKLDKVPHEMVKDEVFRKMTDTLTPQGVLCVVSRKHWTLKDMMESAVESGPVYMVLETIQDPGNLGTIMRTAEGAGVTGIIMNNETVDIYNPKTVRSTMGSIFRVPFVYESDLKKSVGELKSAGVTCYAAHLKGERSCFKTDFKGPAAFFVGNEGNGLSDELTAMADVLIRIPMGGKLESLNAAVSAAVLMYEARRQRLAGNERS